MPTYVNVSSNGKSKKSSGFFEYLTKRGSIYSPPLFLQRRAEFIPFRRSHFSLLPRFPASAVYSNFPCAWGIRRTQQGVCYMFFCRFRLTGENNKTVRLLILAKYDIIAKAPTKVFREPHTKRPDHCCCFPPPNKSATDFLL